MENKITKALKTHKIKFICISAIILIALLGALLILPSLIAPEKDDHSNTEWTVNDDCTERALVCSVCRMVIQTEAIEGSQGLVIENGVVISLGTCTDVHVVIPSVYEGQPVTRINADAFEPVWMDLMLSSDSRVWDDYVETIADQVVNVYIPASVTIIDSNSFNYCSSLENIYVAEGNPNYLSLDGVLYSKDFKELIQYPCAKADENFEIPNGIETIDDSAFYRASKLKHLTIPASVYSMRTWMLFASPSIESIAVDKNNKFYSSVDGVLYSKDKKTLYSYPAAKAGDSFTVPDGVEIIGQDAFYNAKNLVSVNLPDTLSTIKKGAFMSCNKLQNIDLGNSVSVIEANAFCSCKLLESITIPASVTYLDSSTFTICDSFTDIYYEGTILQWNNIDKDDSFITHYGPITVHCTNGTTEYYY